MTTDPRPDPTGPASRDELQLEQGPDTANGER